MSSSLVSNYILGLNKLAKVIEESKVKKVKCKGETYYYIVNPLTSGLGSINPTLLKLCGELLCLLISNCKVNYIIAFETMGIHMASLISVKTGLPLVIARKYSDMRGQLCDGGIVFSRKTKYDEALFIVCGVCPGSNVVLVDSIVSTGSTIISAIKSLRKANIDVERAVCFIERIEYNARENIYKRTGVPLKSILKVCTVDGQVRAYVSNDIMEVLS